MPALQMLPADTVSATPIFVLKFSDEAAAEAPMITTKQLAIEIPAEDAIFDHEEQQAELVKCTLEPVTGNELEQYAAAQELIQQQRKQRKEQRKQYKRSRQSKRDGLAPIAAEGARLQKGRPSLDDVLKLSHGQRSRSRAGSRQV